MPSIYLSAPARPSPKKIRWYDGFQTLWPDINHLCMYLNEIMPAAPSRLACIREAERQNVAEGYATAQPARLIGAYASVGNH